MAQHHLELSFELGELQPEAAEAVCRDCGALAVTLSAADSEQVFEPWPGELKLWGATRVQALFDAASAAPTLLLELAARLDRTADAIAVRAVPERVWEREWLRDFHAMRFGQRLWICPHHESVDASDAVVVHLDPGLAFGTGTHPSTALCLQWLDRERALLPRGELIDYGCGSGILAIAALKLGAPRAHAFDIDPQALIATRENAQANAVDDRLRIHERGQTLPAGSPLLVANILGSILLPLAPRFAELVAPAGRLLLAGVLTTDATEMAAAFAKWFDIEPVAEREGWMALSGSRLNVPA